MAAVTTADLDISIRAAVEGNKNTTFSVCKLDVSAAVEDAHISLADRYRRDNFVDVNTSALIKAEGDTTHFHFNIAGVRNASVTSASFVFHFDVEGTGALVHLGQRVLADAVEVNHVPVIRSVVGVTDRGAAAE